ncbi:MAG: 50S ribosomal protein L24 [Desulfovibrionales bacterium]
MNKFKIKKDDKVMVLTGKDKGKVGKVLQLLRKKDAVLVEQVNKVKRHVKANPYKGESGGIVEKEAPLHISNVAILCGSCAKPSRVGYKTTESGEKIRYCKKCEELID